MMKVNFLGNFYKYSHENNYTGIIFICYPLVPLLAFLNLLWKRPKNWKRKEDEDDSDSTQAFRKAKYLATLASGITGGIESPLQFTLQVTVICSLL